MVQPALIQGQIPNLLTANQTRCVRQIITVLLKITPNLHVPTLTRHLNAKAHQAHKDQAKVIRHQETRHQAQAAVLHRVQAGVHLQDPVVAVHHQVQEDADNNISYAKNFFQKPSHFTGTYQHTRD